MAGAFCERRGPQPGPTRYAVYFVPRSASGLGRRGSALLGRCCDTGATLPRPELPGVSPRQVAARTLQAAAYGLHATLKAPFFLAKGRSEQELAAAARDFARRHQTFDLPGLELTRLGSFFALVPDASRPGACAALERLHALAADAVAYFDGFRAPASVQELERRRARGLTPEQLKNLEDWGYPFVFDAYRFHLTLTDRLRGREESENMEAGLRAWLAPVLDAPLSIDAVCLCRQDVAPVPETLRLSGAPFWLMERFALGG